MSHVGGHIRFSMATKSMGGRFQRTVQGTFLLRLVSFGPIVYEKQDWNVKLKYHYNNGNKVMIKATTRWSLNSVTCLNQTLLCQNRQVYDMGTKPDVWVSHFHSSFMAWNRQVNLTNQIR